MSKVEYKNMSTLFKAEWYCYKCTSSSLPFLYVQENIDFKTFSTTLMIAYLTLLTMIFSIHSI